MIANNRTDEFPLSTPHGPVIVNGWYGGPDGERVQVIGIVKHRVTEEPLVLYMIKSNGQVEAIEYKRKEDTGWFDYRCDDPNTVRFVYVSYGAGE